MGKDINIIAEKFIDGNCTPGEAKLVIDWFDSPSGKKFLNEQLDKDLSELDEYPSPAMYDQVPTQKIRQRLEKAKKENNSLRSVSAGYKSKSRFRKTGVLIAAASILLLITASVLQYEYFFKPDQSQPSAPQPITYNSGVEQHKVLTLSDGSSIRLNSNSVLTVPKSFKGNTREVTLKGEAYFEIESNPQKPFIVNTDLAVIKVLGTAFNVKANAKASSVQVAVKEGKVSFSSATLESEAVYLTKNQFGYLEGNSGGIQIEQVQPDNYLSWMTNRFVFKNTPFPKVCTQIQRIYGVEECIISNKEVSNLHFTASFERRSLEATLEIISNSLEISYSLEGDTLKWSK